MNKIFTNIWGLSNDEVIESRQKFGENIISKKSENNIFKIVKSIGAEPMVILLLLASIIYFISGKINDGIFLALAILLVAAISIYQDKRSKNALELLKNYTQSTCKVIRNGLKTEILSSEIVINDCLLVEEGDTIAADGIIIEAHDFSANESILTGESLSVFKSLNQSAFQGTNVVSGSAILRVTAIASQTQMGKVGLSLLNIDDEKTPLERQINNFVKKMVFLGAVVFIIVLGINFYHSHHFTNSLLKALTLAMSILPEEIPVAFTSFMALGAWRLMKMGIIVKQMKTVETLGSASVICVDKTGTITQNKMELAKIYLHKSNTIFDLNENTSFQLEEILSMSMWSSEPNPFDPMEIAIHQAYSKFVAYDERKNAEFIHEYPLGGKPPMMTHVFKKPDNQILVACKGAPEAILNVCDLSEKEIAQIHLALNVLASEGFRILGVGHADFNESIFPKSQHEFKFRFIGLISFYDPPKQNIKEVLQGFYNAGIDVKIITGDNTITTTAIAKKIDFKGVEHSISGEQIIAMAEPELQSIVLKNNLFTRMFPEAKLRVINALKSTNQIVAMTGDGVNDGPALKAAHIGIAMGKKGTSIAKDAASLILIDDDLSKMIDAIATGRKIYTNLKKAIQYIISIHIPIILTVFFPLILGWIYPNIFSPIHIIFLELIMGPTCSIIYENEPIELNAMHLPPRKPSATFFNIKELGISILQGLMITAGTLFTYQWGIHNNASEIHIRTMVFIVLIASNIFLTLENRSFYYSVYKTMHYKNKLVIVIIAITIILSAMLIYIKPLSNFFEFDQLALIELVKCTIIAFVSVFWFEFLKWVYRKQNPEVFLMPTN
ncbi:MAG TPA: cation-translocating P-type ATPase [Bacteroidia bacterium]|nr:cation-translocating P-type ATPase [Bacteroidia bacterium]